MPQEYLSRAYNDAPKYCGHVDTQLKNNEVILSGEILLGVFKIS